MSVAIAGSRIPRSRGRTSPSRPGMASSACEHRDGTGSSHGTGRRQLGTKDRRQAGDREDGLTRSGFSHRSLLLFRVGRPRDCMHAAAGCAMIRTRGVVAGGRSQHCFLEVRGGWCPLGLPRVRDRTGGILRKIKTVFLPRHPDNFSAVETPASPQIPRFPHSEPRKLVAPRSGRYYHVVQA